MMHLSWEYRVTLVCWLLIAILCLLLGVEWLQAKSYREDVLNDIFKVNKASFEMQPIPEYPFLKDPIERYAEMLARPVFFEGRKPIDKVVEETNQATTTPVVQQPAQEFKYILTGIINTPKGVRALFNDPQATAYGDKHKRMKIDEILGGWKLITIEADKVIIQADAEKKEIPLLKAKPKKAATMPLIPGGLPSNTPGQPVPPPPPPNVNPFNLKH